MFLPYIATRSRLFRVVVPTLLFFFSISSSTAQDIQPRIDEYLKSKVTQNRPGITALVARGDDVILRRKYGQNGSKPEAVGQSRFSVGTIAEQFVAAAVLRLQEQGKAKLDTSICQYLSGCPNDWKEIQILQLLTHTSGLPLLAQSFVCSSKALPAQMIPQVLAAVGRQTLEFKPGSTLRYNQLDYILLSAVVESASGRSSRAYIETEIFGALKMTGTGLSDRFVKPPLEKPSKSAQNAEIDAQSDNAPLCYGDHAYSTIEDLLVWVRALTKSSILSRESLVQMFTPFRDGQGFGWKVVKEFGRELLIQNGGAPGQSVSIRLYPDDDTYVIVASIGMNPDSAELTHGIGAILFGRNYPVSGGSGVLRENDLWFLD